MASRPLAIDQAQSPAAFQLPLTPPRDHSEYRFEDLVDDIKRILGPSSGIDSADVDVQEIMDAMRQFDETVDLQWEKYAFAEPSRAYTRNGVDDINHKANLLILVWNPTRGSMVHDHANAHCIMKILRGTLTETLYDWPEGGLEASQAGLNAASLKVHKSTDLHAGDVAYMSDDLGIHRIVNRDPSQLAVSLHLYTPPYAAKFGCHVFDEATGRSHKVNMSTLYSDRGVLTDSKAGTC